MIKVHLDTDLGGDIDDLCALAMLLRWPDVTLTGITVVGDTNGVRTGYTRYALGLEDRTDIPVAAGADVSQGFIGTHFRRKAIDIGLRRRLLLQIRPSKLSSSLSRASKTVLS